MKKIIHLSDLHFGTENKIAVDAIQNSLQTLKPDVIVISGDLTQRARTYQFKLAKEFINQLPTDKIICVPGNHDISLHNLIERFAIPYRKYQHYICQNLNPTYTDDTVAIFGINSTTPYKVQDGIVTQDQLLACENFFRNQPENIIRIVTMHHNMLWPEIHKVITNTRQVTGLFLKCHVDLILSGHLHDAYFEQIKNNTEIMYAITAGTAISRRLRTQHNSFNELAIDKNIVKIRLHALENEIFSIINEQILNLKNK